MSRLKKLDSVTPSTVRQHPGPVGACDVYGMGDLDDWAEVERRRHATSWAEAQTAVDALLKIATPITADHFRYHWRGRCRHWTTEEKAQIAKRSRSANPAYQ